MRYLSIAAAAVILAGAGPVSARGSSTITGDYVEARTAEVFTGGCIMSMEGESMGREAVMAWRVNRGQLGDVSLDGLKVVAVVAGDVNLGTRELGGAAPTEISAIVLVDERATEAQRGALLTLARSLSNGLVGPDADVRTADVSFERDSDAIRVQAGAARLNVATKMEHNPSCGAVKWFNPLGRVEGATIGMTKMFAFGDSSLLRRWEQTDRRSAFFGTFNLSQ
ncbi:MAG TPA: DUF1326 domain-containing protein [Vicinamibacterales bacterium]|jgi:hypothetical protein|nr:DUF1326 domain-containing protein [Vicinamibacterales bacterium]